MQETVVIQIHTKKQNPKKVSSEPTIKVVKQRMKKVKVDENGDVILPPSQKFEIQHGEKYCIVKTNNTSFGIKIESSVIENIMQNCDKDIDIIRNIISIMRNMKKNNISFASIAQRLEVATQSLPQTIRQFQSALNKPISEKPIAITV